jgi:hypothetical protein
VKPRRRLNVFIALVITLAIGVASRKLVSPLPYWLKEVGDVLWTMAIYWTIALIRPAWGWRVIGPLALGIAWASELQQLIDADWLRPLRKWPVLKMLLGRGFSWVDMAMYPIGAVGAVVIDLAVFKPRRGDEL